MGPKNDGRYLQVVAGSGLAILWLIYFPFAACQFSRFSLKLTERRCVWPKSGLRAPDDGLADEDEAFVAHVLHGVTDQVVTVGNQATVRGRQRSRTFDGWKK